ncbi:MAG: hypothetical protein CMI53_01320 [Parcubacteria group bacterium]|jgi:hypothetical protein|nr:hypothetical protein [Parcubacteria group bacterium]|tara:strand:+ start:3852 stop:4187 length:336 start_codon:yes stop_codon:yes gene_type:complete
MGTATEVDWVNLGYQELADELRKDVPRFNAARNAGLRKKDRRWIPSMRGADLRDADLRDADLRNVSLVSADLRGANLEGANLAFANVQGTRINPDQAIAMVKALAFTVEEE